MRKRRQSQRRSYRKLAAEASTALPGSLVTKISADAELVCHVLPRSGCRWGWPESDFATGTEELQTWVRKVTRILLAYELYASKEKSSVGLFGYVTGVHLIAGMCLGFLRGREEDSFWLFAHIIEDIFGRGYFSTTPPLLGYHGDRASATALVTAAAPRLAAQLGQHRLTQVMSILTTSCFLSCFAGTLPDEPLVAFWEELLEGGPTSYPRWPLLSWLAGLVWLSEDDMVRLVDHISDEDLAPLLTRRVLQTGRLLPDGARPGIMVPEVRVRELRQLADEPLLLFAGSSATRN